MNMGTTFVKTFGEKEPLEITPPVLLHAIQSIGQQQNLVGNFETPYYIELLNLSHKVCGLEEYLVAFKPDDLKTAATSSAVLLLCLAVPTRAISPVYF